VPKKTGIEKTFAEEDDKAKFRGSEHKFGV
jgi:hypothetical protein